MWIREKTFFDVYRPEEFSSLFRGDMPCRSKRPAEGYCSTPTTKMTKDSNAYLHANVPEAIDLIGSIFSTYLQFIPVNLNFDIA